jgi:uncharacterized protein YjbI with pentapeptide repeats
LRAAGVQVEDEPDDEAPPARSPAETEATRKKIEEQREQDAALTTYTSQMENLMINNNLRNSWPDAEVRRVARARTLTAIRRLDGNHNQKLFQFLHEMGLLAPLDPSQPSLVIVNKGMPILDMSGANLQGANLERVNLQRIYLRGTNLQRANLRGAKLVEANLQGATLVETNLEGANLQGVNLRWANLQRG